MSEELSVDDLVRPQPDDQMTNHAEQHSLITDLIVAKDKLQQEIEARVEAGETIQQQILAALQALEAPPEGTARFQHGSYTYPGYGSITGGQPGNFALNKFDALGNKVIAPKEGDAYTYKLNGEEKSFVVTFVAATATQVVMQGNFDVISKDGDIIEVAAETVGVKEHTHELEEHNHSDYLTLGGEQLGNADNWKLRILNTDGEGGRLSFIDIKDNELHLYHVADPGNPAHAANWGYIDEKKADKDHEHSPAPLGRPFVYGNSDLPGYFTTASGSTSIYFNKTDANGQTRRHRHSPDFNWDTYLKYTIWDENGVLVHAGLTGLKTDYNDDKLQFKQCRPLYDMGLVTDTTYYINLEGYW